MEDKKTLLYAANIKFAGAHNHFQEICPFYYSVYCNLERIETDSIPTMAVSTDKLLYNRKFVEELSYREFLFVLAHEMCHVALQHPIRRENRDSQLFNIACDMYVNKFILEDIASFRSLSKVPANGIYDPHVDLRTDTVESLYERLYEQAMQNGYLSDQDGAADGGNGGEYTFQCKDGTPFTVSKNHVGDLVELPGDRLEQRRQLERILSEADRYCKKANLAPGMLGRAVRKMTEGYVDWRKLLRHYCILAKSQDSTFSNPDKRMYYTENAIYPGQEAEEAYKLKDIKICIDTSGSISDEDLEYFLGEIRAITKHYQTEAEVIAWDTQMSVVGHLTAKTTCSDILNCGNKLRGAGGTDPSCLFEYFDSKKCRRRPAATLIFTDGYISRPNNAKWTKKYKDTIWILSRSGFSAFTPPFGKVAPVKIK